LALCLMIPNKNKMTKNAILIAFIAILFAGCVTQRRCNLRFPPSTETVTLITEHDSIVYKDTTIFVKLPGEYRIDSVTIPCPPPPASYKPRRVYAETSLAKASAWWDYPVIKLELTQKDTTIEKRLEDANKEVYRWKNEYNKIVKVPPPVKYIPGIYKSALWGWILVIISAIIYVVIKFKTIIFKI
jgi:hypothetical protein